MPKNNMTKPKPKITNEKFSIQNPPKAVFYIGWKNRYDEYIRRRKLSPFLHRFIDHPHRLCGYPRDTEIYILGDFGDFVGIITELKRSGFTPRGLVE